MCCFAVLTEQFAMITGNYDQRRLIHTKLFKFADNLTDAVRAALTQVDGTYGIAVVSSRHPQTIVAARMGSPLVLGSGDGELAIQLQDIGHDVLCVDISEIAINKVKERGLNGIQRLPSGPEWKYGNAKSSVGVTVPSEFRCWAQIP